MKIKITLELELPEVIDNNVNLNSEYIAGTTWEMAYVIQDVFDNFLNYSICSHLRDAMKWLGNKNSQIVKHHNDWADILRKAEPTMKIEKI